MYMCIESQSWPWLFLSIDVNFPSLSWGSLDLIQGSLIMYSSSIACPQDLLSLSSNVWDYISHLCLPCFLVVSGIWMSQILKLFIQELHPLNHFYYPQHINLIHLSLPYSSDIVTAITLFSSWLSWQEIPHCLWSKNHLYSTKYSVFNKKHMRHKLTSTVCTATG